MSERPVSDCPVSERCGSAWRLGVSNLAWPAAEQDAALALLASLGADGIEVAPTRLAPWEEITDAHLAGLRSACEQAGLVVSSLQAIFFGKPDAALLGDPPAFGLMAEHLRRVGGIAQALGAGVAVFGAPRNRLRGGLSPAEARALGAERLRLLGGIADRAGLTLALEPVPPAYGADFLNHAGEVVEMVRLAGHPRIRAHLDTACVTLAGDDVGAAIREAAPLLAHYHMAEPQLGSFASPCCDHRQAAEVLNQAGYAGWMVIEMRETSLAEVATAIDLAQTLRR